MKTWLVCCAIGLALGGTALGARKDPATEEAKVHYAKGKTHYDLGEYQQALAEYKEAYRIKALPGFLFNIAQCLRKLGDYPAAINLYQSYLAQDPKADTKTVESLLAESRARLAEKEQAEKEQAEKEQAAKEQAAKEQAAKEQAERERVAREQEERERAAREQAAKEQAARVSAGVGAQGPPSHTLRNVGLVGLIAGVLAVGGGVAAGVVASGAQGSFDRAQCGDPMVLLTANELARCRSDRQAGEQGALAADVLFVAGGAVAAISLVMILADRILARRAERRAPTARVGLSAFALEIPW